MGLEPSKRLLAVKALDALGQAYREDWSDFDGRTLRGQLQQVGALIEREAAGDDVRGAVVGLIASYGQPVPDELVKSDERLVRWKSLVIGWSSEQEPEEPIRRFLWLYERDGMRNWHTTDEPKPDADLSAWSVRGLDLDTGAEIIIDG